MKENTLYAFISFLIMGLLLGFLFKRLIEYKLRIRRKIQDYENELAG